MGSEIFGYQEQITELREDNSILRSRIEELERVQWLYQWEAESFKGLNIEGIRITNQLRSQLTTAREALEKIKLEGRRHESDIATQALEQLSPDTHVSANAETSENSESNTKE